MSYLSKLWAARSDIQTLAQLLAWLFPTGALVVSAWSAWALNQPLYLVLFYASGVFAFVAYSTVLVTQWARENSLMGKLRITAFKIVFGKDPSGGDLFAQCAIDIHNTSLFDIYHEIEDAVLSLDGRTNSSPPQKHGAMLIQAGTTTTFSFASIPNVDMAPMGGLMTIKIKYGKKADAMNRTAKFVAAPRIGIALDPKTNVPVGVTTTLGFHSIEYT